MNTVHAGPSHVSNLPIARDTKAYASSQRMLAFGLAGFVGMWLGSEYLVHALGYPEAFSKHRLLGPIYEPWFMLWPGAKLFSAHLEDIALAARLTQALYVAYGVFAVSIVVGLLVGARQYRWGLINAKKPHAIHGSARWAEPLDVASTSLLPPTHPLIAKALRLKAKNDPKVDPTQIPSMEDWMRQPGVYVGEYADLHSKKRYWMRDVSDRHVMLFAPTRAGKSVSIIVPTCLSWSESIVVNDPKGELFALTAHYRKNRLKQRVFKFDPSCDDGSSARINVLDFIRIGTEHEVADAQNIAKIIVDPNAMGLDTGSESDHWRKTAYAFMTGILLHARYCKDVPIERKNLAGVDAMLSNPSKSMSILLKEMQTYPHDPTYSRGWQDAQGRLTATCPTVAAAGNDMAGRPDSERGSVLSSVKSYLDLYREPIVARNTSTSDFSFEDLMFNDRPMTLYLINNPDNMERLRPLMRLIVNMIVTTFTGSIEFSESGRARPKYKHKLLLCMDEFTSTLGKLSILSNGIAFVAGYGIKVLIVCQDTVQLADVYGDKGAKAITSNMHTQIIFATNNDDTAVLVSKMLGQQTIAHETRSWNGGKKSHSESLVGVNLLSPDQLQAMPDSEQIVVVTNNPPIACKKIVYYQETAFTSRIGNAPDCSDVIPAEERAFNRMLPDLYRVSKVAAEERRQEAMRISARLDAEGIKSEQSPAFRELLDDDDLTSNNSAFAQL